MSKKSLGRYRYSIYWFAGKSNSRYHFDYLFEHIHAHAMEVDTVGSYREFLEFFYKTTRKFYLNHIRNGDNKTKVKYRRALLNLRLFMNYNTKYTAKN